jgi:hypothetical protein
MLLNVLAWLVPILIALYLGRKYLLPQKSAIPATARGGLATVKRRRRFSFPQAMGCANEYIAALQNPPYPLDDGPGHEQLARWGVHALVTGAAQISRYSQGKANYWVVASRKDEIDGTCKSIHLRSYGFVGIYPLWQLRDDGGRYREFLVPLDGGEPATAIGQSVLYDRIALYDLRADNKVSDREKKLKTTHVLAIPARRSLEHARKGVPVGISIDIRMSKLGAVLYRNDRTWLYKRLQTRAENIQSVARDLARCPLFDTETPA